MAFVPFPGNAPDFVKPAQRLASPQGNVDGFTLWLRNSKVAKIWTLQSTEGYQRWQELRDQRNAVLRESTIVLS